MRLRHLTLSLLSASLLAASPALAAKKKPADTKAATAKPGETGPETVVAVIGGQKVTLGDLVAAQQELPPQARQMDPGKLYPLLLDQLVDREALVIEAKKEKLQSNPAVKEAMDHAADTVLQNALLRQDIAPQINETALRAIYDKEIGTKPGEMEVQASHILVPTEQQAKDIIAQLNKGADFATLAKQYSTDPTGKSSGGDLGYFKKGDMVPEFADAAFAMQPGQITQTPVHTRYGWHVIKVTNKRQSPPPTFDEVKQMLQQELVQNLIKKEVDKAKTGLKVVEYNSDGSPAKGAPAYIPPPQAAAAAAPTPAPGATTPAQAKPAPAAH